VAIVATGSDVPASCFSVSPVLAMLTDARLVPHSHFEMPGDVQRHTLVYAVVLAIRPAGYLNVSRDGRVQDRT
jgi:hypothetical protein